MSNDLQTNLGYFMMINYMTVSLCHLTDIFFAIHAGAKKLNRKWIRFVNRRDRAPT